MTEVNILVHATLIYVFGISGLLKTFLKRRANQEIVPVPLFRVLKRLKPFKRIMVERAREMI